MSEIQVMVSLRTYRRACRSRLFRPKPRHNRPLVVRISLRLHLVLDLIAMVRLTN